MCVVLEGVMQADDVRVLLVRQVLQHLPGVTHVTHVTSGMVTAARELAGPQEASARGGRHLLLGDRMLDAL